MDNFPIEILNNIFIYMDLFERIKCTLVCRHWHRVLQEYSLFKNAAITRNGELLGRFLHVMEESPHYAAQVEELCVDEFANSEINKRTFANIFPNARVIIVQWRGEDYEVEAHVHHSIQLENSHPTSKVKTLHDMVYCELASQMLVANTCDGLTELKLDFVDPFLVEPLHVIHQLKSLPALRSLTLERCNIGLHALEGIHDGAPNLRELKLDDIRILRCSFPSPITPANSMTSIVINISGALPDDPEEPDNNQHVEPFELFAPFYQYMSIKYPNLIHVKHFNSELFTLEPDQRRFVFLNGLIDFYRRSIHPTTTELYLQDVPNDANIFDVCDENNCQIAELEAHRCDRENFFQFLIGSNQCNHILQLNLLDTEIVPLSSLLRLEALQALNLSFIQPTSPQSIHLTDYLNSFPPSLKHLSINCPNITTDPRNTNLSEIETLTLCCRNPGLRVCELISTKFPNLVELEIICTVNIQRSIELNLHSPSLQRATFSYTKTTRRGYVFAYKSLNETEFQCYHITDRATTELNNQRLPRVPILTVTTLGMKRVDISDKITLLPL